MTLPGKSSGKFLLQVFHRQDSSWSNHPHNLSRCNKSCASRPRGEQNNDQIFVHLEHYNKVLDLDLKLRTRKTCCMSSRHCCKMDRRPLLQARKERSSKGWVAKEGQCFLTKSSVSKIFNYRPSNPPHQAHLHHQIYFYLHLLYTLQILPVILLPQ